MTDDRERRKPIWLTDATMQRMKYDPELGTPNEIADAQHPKSDKPSGLRLVIQPSGKTSWIIRYRHNGKPRKLTLSGFPTLADARKLNDEAQKKIAQGLDPAGEKQEARREAQAAPDKDLFPTVLATYLKHYKDGRATRRRSKPKERTLHDTARLLGVEADPDNPGAWRTLERGKDDPERPAHIWRDKRIQDIRKRDVIGFLDDIVDRGAPYVANRSYAALSPLFAWAVARDMIEVSPVVWNKAAEQARERVLTDAELKWFWTATGGLGHPFCDVFRLLLLTGQRREEVGAMEERELDLEKRLWTLPASRAKNGREHVVPLSEAAVTILRAAIERPGRIGGKRGFLFTTTGETPPSGYSKAKATCDTKMLETAQKEAAEAGRDPAEVALADWTLHDLRRTLATKMNDELGIDPHIVEAVLNHVSGTRAGVAGVYNRAAYLNQKQAALEAWGRWVLALVGEAKAEDNVIPLRAG